MDLHVASITPSFLSKEQEAWNEAYDRLVNFLNTFMLGDHAYTSRLALDLLTQAQELHRQDASRDPTTQVMENAQKRLTSWLAANLEEKDQSPSHILATGYVALLLSHLNGTAPTAFLASPLPDELKNSLRQTLLTTGPDLNVSSMTPRHLDYGPMLHIARQTWHRLDVKELVIALLFWGCVYTVFYWWLSRTL
jgi:hypothetical protein